MLPKIDVPIYELTLPLTKKTVRFRPFLVKEEKILLMAMESNENDTVILAVKQILNNCCIDEIDINSLPVADMEFLFLNLRARSVGEVVELPYKCNHKITNDKDEEKECGNIVTLEVNVLEINPEIDPSHTNSIELADKMGIIMKYPSFKMVEDSEKSKDVTEVEKVMNILIACIDSIYTEEEIFYAKDVSKNELVDFVESLTRDQFLKIQGFFDTIPKIKKDIHFECGKCGYQEDITIEGLQSFFV
jgi:hypothetical protein